MPRIRITPLGAGQDVGRSCILVTIGGKNIMLDCGMHMGFTDERRFPDFTYICIYKLPGIVDYTVWQGRSQGGIDSLDTPLPSAPGDLTSCLDCVIISHFHLDHCGALPYMTEMVGYSGPLYMTYPSKAIVPVLLEDFRKVVTEHRGETSNFFTSQMIKDCMKKVTAVNLHEIVHVDDQLSIQAFYAGHVLGAAMFLVKVGSESVLYTGDFNMTPDRHLEAAKVPPGLRPDILITETTYATTVRESKRVRERDFLNKVHETVQGGGKVLIPVFALGRAQELCILLDMYWERLELKVPIYFSAGLASRATEYYRLFINWTNEKVKRTFVHRNIFDFKHIKPFRMEFADIPGPMVLFSTPGMLHGGQSLKVFKKWCSDERNAIIMPGYCTAGTVGAKVIAGAKKLEIDGKMHEINLKVEYMSFSAHADAKGIKQLIRDVEPNSVLFVHGEAQKMDILKGEVEKEFGLNVYKPANGETVSISSQPSIYVQVPEPLIRRSLVFIPPKDETCPIEGFLFLDKQSNELTMLSNEEAAKHLGVELHSICLSEIFCVSEPKINWEDMAERLKLNIDPELQIKPDGIELFDSELILAKVPEHSDRIEIIWDECREHFFSIMASTVSTNKSKLELSVHQVEPAIVVRYIDERGNDNNSSQLKIIQLKGLSERSNPNAVARFVQDQCQPLIPIDRLSELEQLISSIIWRGRSSEIKVSSYGSADIEKLDDYLELLYDEGESKNQGISLLLQLVCETSPSNLPKIVENEPLMGALVRVMKEDARRNFDLAIQVGQLFNRLSQFSPFLPILSRWKIGLLSLQLVEQELRRSEVWREKVKELSDLNSRRNWESALIKQD
uniref:Integrator complex subunit 11 n=1 Tax=Meloidogyne floridensis TaxID=298350 RepID=A0A915P779_9BILA